MDRDRLRADCARCTGLCCVALPFARSADFAIDKPAGVACPNLLGDHRCGIHDSLRDRGFRGCTVFDCQGAGQQVVQITFGGRRPDDPAQVHAVFHVMRVLHELLWYLTESVEREPHNAEAVRCLTVVETLTGRPADELAGFDIRPVRAEVAQVLRAVSRRARSGVPDAADHSEADLMGVRLTRADLRGASLRSACLIAVDLRWADLREADLLGADLRDADLGGADLTGALFVTRSQLAAARGDATTKPPQGLERPTRWTV